MSDVGTPKSVPGGPSLPEWRERACRAEDRLRRIEPERDEYKAAWLDALERIRVLEAACDPTSEAMSDG